MCQGMQADQPFGVAQMHWYKSIHPFSQIKTGSRLHASSNKLRHAPCESGGGSFLELGLYGVESSQILKTELLAAVTSIA